MLILVGVLLKMLKCVTPSGPAIATKSLSTFFFLTCFFFFGKKVKRFHAQSAEIKYE